MAKKTPEILDLFKQLSAFPRCSGNEAGVCSWLQDLSASKGFQTRVDAVGNLVILVPATKGYENSPTVVLQGHMDMVCEKTPDSTHDFTKDPIQNIVDGDWLRADRTTLGSDNGIAIALALAVANDTTIAHAPLELLFTVKEEVGLSGVNYLKPGFITGNTLINLDSEDEGTFIVGCAGGQTTFIVLPITPPTSTSQQGLTISIEGCRGGHSGVDIDKNFASANKILARTLFQLKSLAQIQISKISGGSAHNAISRSAQATITIPQDKLTAANELIKSFEAAVNQEHTGVEAGIRIVSTPASPETCLSIESSNKLIDLLNALPHGVSNMSYAMPEFVETSNNLARIEQYDDHIKVITSQRGTSASRLTEITNRIIAIGQLAGATVTLESSYPSWQPNMQSKVLSQCKDSFSDLFGKQPKIESIHAGLECSSIGNLFPGIDMISIGVTIENPHSPTERMYIPSIEKIWELLVEVLKNLK